MSLVGPRPEMPFIIVKYGKKERRRLQVNPGLTGLWRLRSDRAFVIHENIEGDLYYIQHRNLFMDRCILRFLRCAEFSSMGGMSGLQDLLLSITNRRERWKV
jgi:lipopolysaccharide/colanic/teichoic acid biosynthesis glycosyltransferase